MHIGEVFIGQSRPAVSSALNSALELAENANSGSYVPVDMKEIPLEEIAVLIFGIGTETRVLVVFVSQSGFASQRDKPVIFSQADVLDWIKGIGAAFRFGEEAPVLVKTEPGIRWSRTLCLRKNMNRSKEKEEKDGDEPGGHAHFA